MHMWGNGAKSGARAPRLARCGMFRPARFPREDREKAMEHGRPRQARLLRHHQKRKSLATGTDRVCDRCPAAGCSRQHYHTPTGSAAADAGPSRLRAARRAVAGCAQDAADARFDPREMCCACGGGRYTGAVTSSTTTTTTDPRWLGEALQQVEDLKAQVSALKTKNERLQERLDEVDTCAGGARMRGRRSRTAP